MYLLPKNLSKKKKKEEEEKREDLEATIKPLKENSTISRFLWLLEL